MKIILQSTSFFLVGMIILSACTEEKTGNYPDKIANEIEVDFEEIVQDTVPLDTTVVEEPIAPPPPPPEPLPPGPEPIPDPPEPEPFPEPIPEPIPEPTPAPVLPLVATDADVAPMFPGDSSDDSRNMNRFIANNIRYPEIDREMGVQGRVYVEFIVEKDGSLSNIKIPRGVSKTMDKEAVRVMKLMPNWTPAVSDGKKVRVRMYVPINFRLD